MTRIRTVRAADNSCRHTQPGFPRVSAFVALLAMLAWLLAMGAVTGVSGSLGVVTLQAAAGQPVETDVEPAAEEHGEAEAEHESIWETVARLVNFAVLAGGLFVVLRTPLVTYLRDRGGQVRQDLETARLTTTDAEQQLVAIEEQLQALPTELEALKERGRNEVAAEEVRMRESTEAARQRLVDQSRREMDLQLRVAKRDLTHRAAKLAVAVASRRIQEHLDDADQLRLIDRYVEQVPAE